MSQSERTTVERVRRILSDIFDIPIEKITEDTSPDTVEDWDSLQHLNVVLALEKEFGVAFTPEDIRELTDLQSIVEAVGRIRESRI